jgi:hypothetical protein
VLGSAKIKLSDVIGGETHQLELCLKQEPGTKKSHTMKECAKVNLLICYDSEASPSQAEEKVFHIARG